MPDAAPTLQAAAHSALKRLTKWRAILAGWQLGSKAKGQPACDAVRDHREATLVVRAELDALTATLISTGVLNHEEYLKALALAADRNNALLEKRFPGVKTTEQGIELDRDLAKPWMSKFPK